MEENGGPSSGAGSGPPFGACVGEPSLEADLLKPIPWADLAASPPEDNLVAPEVPPELVEPAPGDDHPAIPH